MPLFRKRYLVTYRRYKRPCRIELLRRHIMNKPSLVPYQWLIILNTQRSPLSIPAPTGPISFVPQTIAFVVVTLSYPKHYQHYVRRETNRHSR